MSSVVACLAEAYAKAGRHLSLLPLYEHGISAEASENTSEQHRVNATIGSIDGSPRVSSETSNNCAVSALAPLVSPGDNVPSNNTPGSVSTLMLPGRGCRSEQARSPRSLRVLSCRA